MFRVRLCLVGLVLMGVGGFTTWRALASEGAAPGEEFHDKLRQIAADYGSYDVVNDKGMRWAPENCSAPEPSISNSKDKDTHGHKLYFLFVREAKSYLKGQAPAIGQVLVKQSWQPEEVAGKERALKHRLAQAVEKDGKFYRASKQKELFIMFKVDPKTPNTDNGWVYGTVTPDGKTVTSAGRVESCMNCHKDAKNDRLFGIKPIGD
jgi:hypothetical protein